MECHKSRDSKRSSNGKRRRRRKKKKNHQARLSFLLCRVRERVCAWGWGVGVNWYRIKLGGPGPTHTPFLCTNKLNPHAIVVSPPTAFSLPSLVFTAAQCACVNTREHSNVHECALLPLEQGKLSNWVLLLRDSNDLIITSVVTWLLKIDPVASHRMSVKIKTQLIS